MKNYITKLCLWWLRSRLLKDANFYASRSMAIELAIHGAVKERYNTYTADDIATAMRASKLSKIVMQVYNA